MPAPPHTANDALKQARQREHDAYQQVVALVGAGAAAELAGSPPNTNTSSAQRRSRSHKQRAADDEAADDRAAGDQTRQTSTQPAEGSR